MASKAAVRTVPQAVTYTLFLKPATATTKKVTKTNKDIFRVRLGNKKKFWCGVRKGDLVQFIPDPKIKGGGRVEVEFEPEHGASGLPLAIERVQSTAFHLVVSNMRRFHVECYITTPDGVRHGGYLDDGGHPCPLSAC